MTPAAPRALRIPLVPLAALVLAFAVWGAASVQRAGATRSAERVAVAQSLLTSMLDQETGLRGFLLTSDLDFLQPYIDGKSRYGIQDRHMDKLVADDAELTRLERRADALAGRWGREAREPLESTRRHGTQKIDLPAVRQRKALMDGFRAANAELVAQLTGRRATSQRTAALVSAGLAFVVLLLVGGAFSLFLRARAKAEAAREERERRYTAAQTEFAEVLSVVGSESEANDLLRQHLERSAPGRQVTVFNRNNSENRLEAVTEVGDALAVRLVDAEPRSCIAVRLNRPHEENGGDDALVQCDLCGKQGESLCSPLQVSGRVIGSVLLRQATAFDEHDRRRVRESVSQAAPVIGNLRAIAMAEARAATDALTGLPNRRAVDETLRRMVAQAARTDTPLAALAIDIDHFKHVNDRFGHEKGDDVLAAVSAAMAATIRGSDFLGRHGGEEFLVLAPDTDADGGVVLAEKLRSAIARVKVRGLEHAVTASIGVAVLPQDAADGSELLRRADRALYGAKERGRNRVESAGAPTAVTPA